jgi:hypothetical protein
MMQRRTCVYDDPTAGSRPFAQVDYGRYFENLMQNIGTVTNGFPEAVPFETVANRDNYNPRHPQQPDVRHARRGHRKAAGL